MNRPVLYFKNNNVVTKRLNILALDTYSKLIQWKKSPQILEIGCGTGVTTMEDLVPRVPRDYVKLVGADLQEKMVKFAQEFNKNPKVEFVQFDIAAENILPEKYDHVFSFLTFHWVTKLRKAFKNIYDLLSPEGDMFITVISDIPYKKLFEAMLIHPIWSPYYTKDTIPLFCYCKNAEELLKPHLEESGFANIKIYAEDSTYTFKNWGEILKFFLAVDTIIAKLDEEQKLDYITDFLLMFQEVHSQFEEKSGDIKIPYKIHVVYAAKPQRAVNGEIKMK